MSRISEATFEVMVVEAEPDVASLIRATPATPRKCPASVLYGHSEVTAYARISPTNPLPL